MQHNFTVEELKYIEEEYNKFLKNIDHIKAVRDQKIADIIKHIEERKIEEAKNEINNIKKT